MGRDPNSPGRRKAHANHGHRRTCFGASCFGERRLPPGANGFAAGKSRNPPACHLRGLHRLTGRVAARTAETRGRARRATGTMPRPAALHSVQPLSNSHRRMPAGRAGAGAPRRALRPAGPAGEGRHRGLVTANSSAAFSTPAPARDARTSPRVARGGKPAYFKGRDADAMQTRLPRPRGKQMPPHGLPLASLAQAPALPLVRAPLPGTGARAAVPPIHRIRLNAAWPGAAARAHRAPPQCSNFAGSAPPTGRRPARGIPPRYTSRSSIRAPG